MTTANDFNPVVEDDDIQILNHPTNESPTLAGGAVYAQVDYPLPDHFLDTADPESSDLMETDQQNSMLGGEMAPEPAEFETANGADDSSFAYIPSNSMVVDHQSGNIDYTTWHAGDYFNQDPQQPYDYYPTSGPTSTMVDNPFEEEGVEDNEVEQLDEPRHAVDTLESPPEQQKKQPYVPRYANRGIPLSNDIIKNVQRPWNPSVPTVVRRFTVQRRESTDELTLTRDVGDRARLQNAQRLATPEGWKQLEKWLSTAIEQNEREKIVNLLETCKLAAITVEQLKQTETPKLVKDLSRKHPNSKVNQLSNEILAKWKTIISESAKKMKVKKAEAPKKVDSTAKTTETKNLTATLSSVVGSSKHSDVNLLDKLTEAMDKEVNSRADISALPIAGPSTDQETKPLKNRVKAKVKISRSRKTGLEGDDSDQAPPAKQAANNSTVAARKANVQKKPTPVVQGIEPTSPPASSTKTLDLKNPRTKLTSSGAFLDAFSNITKRPGTRPKLQTTREPRIIDAMPAGESGQEGALSTSEDAPIPLQRRPNPGGGILRKESLSAVEKRLRKIRFADDHGHLLEHVREFEKDENERVNIWKQQTTETDMKHSDMMQEAEALRQSKIHNLNEGAAALDEAIGVVQTAADLSPMVVPVLSSARIVDPRQLPLPNIANLPPLPGVSSTRKQINLIPWKLPSKSPSREKESKLVELERLRESTAMASFINPNFPMIPNNEADPELTRDAEEAASLNVPSIPVRTDEPSSQAVDIKPMVNLSTAPTTDRINVRDLPLPFSSSSTVSTSAVKSETLTDNMTVLRNMLEGGVTPPTSSSTAPADQDFRPDDDGPLDVDFRQSSAAPDDDSPKSPIEPQQSIDNNNASLEASTKSNLTVDEIQRLAAIAGRNNSVGNLGIDLAAILNKVESAQSGAGTSTTPINSLVAATSGVPVFEHSNAIPALTSAAQKQQNFNYGQLQHQYAQEEGSTAGPAPSISAYFPTSVPGASPPRGFAGAVAAFRPPRFPPIRGITPRGAFFHNPTPGTFAPRRAPTVTCRFWLAGACNFGDGCRFLHAHMPSISGAAPVPSSPTKRAEESTDVSNPNMIPVNSSSMVAQFGASGSSFSTEGFHAAPRGRGAFRGNRGRGRGEERGRGRRGSPSSRRYDRGDRYESNRPRRRYTSSSRSRSRSPVRSTRRNRDSRRSRSSTPQHSNSRSTSPVERRRRRSSPTSSRRQSNSSRQDRRESSSSDREEAQEHPSRTLSRSPSPETSDSIANSQVSNEPATVTVD